MSACPHCGAAGRRFVEAFGDTLDRCRACGLVYLEPPPSQAEMVQRHASEEYAAHPYFTQGEEIAKSEALPLHETALAAMARHLKPGARVLDVGAGAGDFLALAAKHYAVRAVEPSGHLAARIRSRVDCPIFVGAFEDYREAQSADAIVLMDIIEHAADPRALLAKARETLRPGGILFVSTVDSASLLYRLGPAVWRLSRFSRFAHYLLHRIFCKQHNWYFNRRVLAGIVRESGLEIVEHEGFEVPLNRLRESRVVLLGLRALYLAHSLLGANTEQYLVARKGP
jgi:2-polyprenyl-3-methyl-5-hydroxy-6-metoxy-1,4-benzoquinol methylase